MEQQLQAGGVISIEELNELKQKISELVSDFTKKSGLRIRVSADTSFYKQYWSDQNSQISSQVNVELLS